MRREFSAKVRAEAFLRANGHCESAGCGARLSLGKYHFDHSLPDWLGGEPTLENCAVLCAPCHREKTSREDVPRIAKAKRTHAKHFNLRPPSHSLPGGRSSPWRKKMNGEVVPR